MGVFRKLQPAFMGSVVFHGALLLLWAWGLAHTQTTPAPRENKFILVEVDPLPKTAPAPDTTRNQVVQTQKTKRSEQAAPNAFLGEQTQRVEKQTVSMPKTGATVAQTTKAKEAPKKSETAETEPPKPKSPLLTSTGALAKFGIAISAGKENSPRPVQDRDLMAQASMTAQVQGEYVKGFHQGEQTVLNTREFVFYGYFQRIREKLDRAWDKSLHDELKKYFYRGRQLASETDYTTQLLVLLDRDGHILKVKVVGESGTSDLDDAATKAFNDAGPFPNPPSGLLDKRGQALVRWDFVLKT